MKRKNHLKKEAMKTLALIVFSIVLLAQTASAKDKFTLAAGNIIPGPKSEVAFVLEYGATPKTVALLLYKRAENQPKLIAVERFTNASNPAIATGNFDSDSEEEIVVTGIDGSGRQAILVFDYDKRSSSLNRIGYLRLEGASNASVATGNFDSDSLDEMVFTLKDSNGQLAILVYDYNNSNNLKRIGDLRLAGASNASTATGNFDNDSQDEMVFTLKDGNGQLAILVYDYNNSNNLKRIGDLRLAGASSATAATGNFDNDSQDEMVFTLKDGNGQLAILVYDYNNSNSLKRIGDGRLAGASNASTSTGNFDNDSKDEMVLTMKDGNGQLAILVYDYNDSNNLKRIGDSRLTGASNAAPATGNFDNDSQDEMIFSMIDGNKKPTILVYDLNASDGTLTRIGDVRIDTNNLEVYVDSNSTNVIDKADDIRNAEPSSRPFPSKWKRDDSSR